jgi:hypothetical protein
MNETVKRDRFIIENALNDIESFAFRAAVGAASTVRRFKSLVAARPEARALIGAVALPEGITLVRRRVHELLLSKPDVEFAHPDDIAIAVFLDAIDIVDGLAGLETAREVSQTSGLWWANLVAEDILRGSDVSYVVKDVETPASSRDVVRLSSTGPLVTKVYSFVVTFSDRDILKSASVLLQSAAKHGPSIEGTPAPGAKISVGAPLARTQT